MSEITIATSIAPGSNIANQQQALDSWLKQGFQVISVNSPEEIDVLGPHFPNIRFVTANRDARERFGKPYIYFDDLLSALYEQGTPICGIVNSDIHLLDTRLYQFVQQEAPGALLFGARFDVDSVEDRQHGEWYRGYDYFFFDRNNIPLYPREDFCIGLPWWDYWIVLIPVLHNIPVKKLISRVAYHVRHTPANLNSNSWFPLGMTYGKYFPAPFELTEATMPRYNPLSFEVLDHIANSVSLPPQHVPISVIVHTLNEERNIGNCLECVKWADEIIVVDMYSDDKTVDIARKYTDKILLHERCSHVEPARQWAVEQTSHEWVLVVDADELVPAAVRDLLRDIADTDAYDAVFIPSANFIFGHLMKGSGRGAVEDHHVRFFKKSLVKLTSKIHQPPLAYTHTRIGFLSGEAQAFIHFNYIDIEHFIEKLNKYTTVEAESDYASGKTFNWQEAWEKSFGTFHDIAIGKEGFQKDGIYGLGLGMLMALYHFAAALKLKLIEDYQSTCPGDKIRDQYQQLAAQIIKQYESK